MPNLSMKQQVRRDLVFAAATARTTKSGRRTREPDSEFHAKVMGATVTLCGQPVLSSFKFNHVPFDLAPGAHCRPCTEALRRGELA